MSIGRTGSSLGPLSVACVKNAKARLNSFRPRVHLSFASRSHRGNTDFNSAWEPSFRRQHSPGSPLRLAVKGPLNNEERTC